MRAAFSAAHTTTNNPLCASPMQPIDTLPLHSHLQLYHTTLSTHCARLCIVPSSLNLPVNAF